MVSVREALERILATAPQALAAENVPLAEGFGRTLAHDVVARRTQPPFDVSAMDGFALRAADAAQPGTRLPIAGRSAAGAGYHGNLPAGTAVRIFTGAPVPPDADAILIQENARYDDAGLTVVEPPAAGRHIRRAGLDFREGEVGLPAGTRLNPAELALAAAMNHPVLPVVRRPLVAILATGDELVQPGAVPGPDQIVASNSFAIMAHVAAAGGRWLDLGLVPDRIDAIVVAIRRAEEAGADVLVTLGGASVGDHDLVQPALVAAGMELAFWKIAMRPGKPMMHGCIGAMRVLGLPGNPVSSIVNGVLFLRPLIRALCGDPRAGADPCEPAILAADLPPNDVRQDYMRGTLVPASDGGLPRVTAGRTQDSSMLRVLAGSGCLVVRPPHATAARAGDACQIIRLDRYPF
ncbi:molybdopterin molybdotransferase MoeA [Lichenihabitans sp. Uapishka_5]|uniref:molybdopterin molybdotransferase MoeA n=1 Tax=Lichenihabitans sp. Uapishka_5 TaxID=3037302 RepID=UPI0029E81A68|nr:gephyrin-like molybdotransferase Glp [Lichenihabitans sp. Uapishka_5]MDX7950883.1 molybdopterin molybdotransferase MoeA [Lichenihabitans sp. Uapishka_5]